MRRRWRVHAQRLRQDAKDAGDATVIVPVHRVGGQGDLEDAEPQLCYKRVVLAEQAIAADQRAAWLDGYLARGSALTSQDLAGLVAELPGLPEAVEPVGV